jgi:UDP-GlcNAc:undecaprenyl-phosphate GlcNAc-1-phosphate transferase
VIAIIISGSILGFLRFNTHPARVFMGDGGSQILGFSAAVLAVVLTQNPETPLSTALPLLLLGIPIVDTLLVMGQRVLAGHSPFKADRNHVHHRLLALGLDHHEAVIVIYVLQAALFVTAWFLRFESDLTIVSVFVVFFASLGLALHLARARGWHWRRVRNAPGESNSGVVRVFQWLARPEHLPRWTLVTIGLVVTVFFLDMAGSCPVPSLDVRVMAGALAVGIALLLATRWRAAQPGWIEKGALYVALVMAVYFDRQTTTWIEEQAGAEWLMFGVLVCAIALRFRLVRDRRFKVTPLDLLVLIVAIAIPALPGSIANSTTIGSAIAKLIALMYAVEMLLEATAGWWRVPSIAAVTFLVACALRGTL